MQPLSGAPTTTSSLNPGAPITGPKDAGAASQVCAMSAGAVMTSSTSARVKAEHVPAVRGVSGVSLCRVLIMSTVSPHTSA